MSVIETPKLQAPAAALPKAKVPIMVVISAAWMILLVLLTLLQPWLPLPDPNISDFASIATPPFVEAHHILGTDEIGRDILARLIAGAYVSLIVGLGSVILAAILGTIIGVCGGYFGGVTDQILSVATDIMLAFPALIALIALGVFLGPGMGTIILGIGIVSTPAVARVARSTTKQVAGRDFVTAARGSGAGHLRILLREILPNVVMPVVAYATVLIAVAIVAEGSLNFLGLGVPAPNSSWGGMMGSGRELITSAPHIILIPAFVMFLTLQSLNLLSEHLAKKLDVKEATL